MLVLERAVGTKVMIGDDIVLTIQDIKADCIQLAIEEAPHTTILDERKPANDELDQSKIQVQSLLKSEALKIANDITVVFLRNRGAVAVVMGIDAPRHIPIYREEIMAE